MSIQNRLRSLEQKTGVVNSEYCRCYGDEILKYEVVPISIQEWNRRWHTGEETMVKLPDIYESCRKPIDKRFIEENFEETQAKIEARRSQAARTVALFED